MLLVFAIGTIPHSAGKMRRYVVHEPSSVGVTAGFRWI
jgi:hypothetical protein